MRRNGAAAEGCAKQRAGYRSVSVGIAALGDGLHQGFLDGGRVGQVKERVLQRNNHPALPVQEVRRLVAGSGGGKHAGNHAAVLAGTLAEGQTTEFTLAPGRAAYLVPVNGTVTVNGVTAQARDGVAISDEQSVTVTATTATELVVVEVAA